ncbi:TlpA disulfide reductase family protein [Streptomyces sp. BE20]|uniref:TlpA family protein disulfide reductase n=1 Tax=Streptomycetaceae TaxID=2062 RepID=UPI002E761105|nr:TlpA disulfide reductase family protein [Streptomyces sp. BE20]MEE1824895.1 TlpA disulfide reductase family protein [Streptomyces sp. BE20]
MSTVFTVVIGCLSVFNLLLTLALARKVTGNSGHGSHGDIVKGVSIPENRIPDGTPVPEFRAVSRQDGPVSRADFSGGRAVVGFFSASCGPCLEQAPDFVKAVTDHPGGRDRVVAVVKGAGAVAEELAAMLAPVAKVVVEPAGVVEGSVAESFGVVRWPSYVEVGADGRITNRLLPGELDVQPAVR